MGFNGTGVLSGFPDQAPNSGNAADADAWAAYWSTVGPDAVGPPPGLPTYGETGPTLSPQAIADIDRLAHLVGSVFDLPPDLDPWR